MYQVEKGIELPESTRGRHRGPSKYPFEKMGIGDSFKSEKPDRTEHARIRSAIKNRKIKFPAEDYTTREVTSGRWRFLRVWRVQ